MSAVRPITQSTIARRLGVSQKTVSLAFGGSPEVGEDLRRRILDSANQLGYRHHSGAQALKRGRFGTIGLILGGAAHASYLPSELLGGIQQVVEAADETLLVSRIEGEAGLARLERSLAVDGLLLDINATVSPALDAAVARLRLPAVWINREQECDAVRPDDHQAGFLAGRLLLERGHRRVLYCDLMLGHDDQLHISRSDRVEGCRAALAEVGLGLRLLAPGKWPVDLLEELTRLFAAADRPTAVVCYSFAEAAAVLRAADLVALRLPRDLSLLTVHNEALHLGVALDILMPPFAAVGAAAVAILHQRVAHPKQQVAIQRLPFVHLPGATLGVAIT